MLTTRRVGGLQFAGATAPERGGRGAGWVGGLITGLLLVGCAEEAPLPAPCAPAHEAYGQCLGAPSTPVCDGSICAGGVDCGQLLEASNDGELSSAIAGAGPGDCIALHAGAYGEASLPGGVSLLSRGAGDVTVAAITVGPGEGAMIRGLSVGAGGVEVAGGAKLVRLEALRVVNAAGVGVTVGEGADVKVVSSMIAGSGAQGLKAVNAASITLEGSVIEGSGKAGLHVECSDGCACATVPIAAVETAIVRDNKSAGIALYGVQATLNKVVVSDNTNDMNFIPSGGLYAGGCADLVASFVSVTDNTSYGVFLQGASADVGFAGDESSGAEISRNRVGMWIQGVSGQESVNLRYAELSENEGVGLAVSGVTAGIIAYCNQVRKTKLVDMPVFTGGNLGGKQTVGDGIVWLEGARMQLENVIMEENARASILIDGEAASGSSIKGVELRGNDEARGVEQQNLPAGAPPVTVAGVSLKTTEDELYSVPVSPPPP